MEIDQAIQCGAVLNGAALAIWFRPIALIIFAPVLFAISVVAHWLLGAAGWLLVWSVTIDLVCLQISYFLTIVFVFRFFPDIRKTRKADGNERHDRLPKV